MHQCREYGRRAGGEGGREEKREKKIQEKKTGKGRCQYNQCRKERMKGAINGKSSRERAGGTWNQRCSVISLELRRVWPAKPDLLQFFSTHVVVAVGLSVMMMRDGNYCVVLSLYWPILKLSLDLMHSLFDSRIPHLTKSGPFSLTPPWDNNWDIVNGWND